MAYGDWNYYHEQTLDSLNKMTEEVKKTLQKASAANEIMSIEPVHFDTLKINEYHFSTIVHNMREYNSYTREYSYPPLAKITEKLEQAANEIIAQIPENDKRINHNIKVKTGLESLFERLGFRKTYHTNERVRGRTKSVEHTSGWVESLYKIPTQKITVEAIRKMVASAMVAPTEHWNKIKAAETQKAYDAEKHAKAEKIRNEYYMQRAALVIKLGLPANATDEDIENAATTDEDIETVERILIKDRWNE
jgi:hypothetical protein